MNEREELLELVEIIEGQEGCDRELDETIARRAYLMLLVPDMEYYPSNINFTSSVSDIFGLAQGTLDPKDWVLSIASPRFGMTFEAVVSQPRSGGRVIVKKHAEPARALLAAFLTACSEMW